MRHRICHRYCKLQYNNASATANEYVHVCAAKNVI